MVLQPIRQRSSSFSVRTSNLTSLLIFVDTFKYLWGEELNSFMHKFSKEYMWLFTSQILLVWKITEVNIWVLNNVKCKFKLFQYLNLRFSVQITCFISFRVVLSKHGRVSLAFWSWIHILAETHQMHFSWSCSYRR